MAIEVIDFMNSIADKLAGQYPQFNVYADKIGQHGFDNCFYIANTIAQQEQRLKHKYFRTYGFDIVFFQESDEPIAFYIWSNEMLMSFTELLVDDKLYFTKNLTTQSVDEVFHCLFEVNFFVKQLPEEPLMERLAHTAKPYKKF